MSELDFEYRPGTGFVPRHDGKIDICRLIAKANAVLVARESAKARADEIAAKFYTTEYAQRNV